MTCTDASNSLQHRETSQEGSYVCRRPCVAVEAMLVLFVEMGIYHVTFIPGNQEVTLPCTVMVVSPG
jgi:hypothetical protein